MNKLRAIELFVKLAEVGSFTRVAEQFNTSKSMISKEISRLEDQLGARLLHRTTRHLQLTQVGEGYLQRARDILSKLEEADSFVLSTQRAPKGKLEINLPMVLGITDLGKVFADFMRTYPDVELDIHLGDEDIDLVEQGFDLGLRATSRPIDSNYIGREITQFDYHICASPEYLATNPAIEYPRDLTQHNCFEYRYFKGKNIWPLDEGVKISGTLKANNVLFMLESIKAGLGIGILPEFACRQAIASKEVISILPDSKKPQLTLLALYPARHHVPASVLQCIQFLQRWFTHHYPHTDQILR
ncbi:MULTISPECIES: LysR family transcriptional regulator [unclassified Pseudoalteromonas]|uniref:LysR family transcriptional regulator n=1 Tax=unclassified Pseudoalteromonas TaxID=194690 RepID=UPI002097DF82|nr:LysR family transcriptional regulator [Pseudoalteromonas sp. XMcav2-N]MCO7189151.1 LysR family transcriptional regulator [Pseudoalteromonas sp. XMcav2-N]